MFGVKFGVAGNCPANVAWVELVGVWTGIGNWQFRMFDVSIGTRLPYFFLFDSISA